jgi:hypothetical protein
MMAAAAHVRFVCLLVVATCLSVRFTAGVVFAQSDAPRITSVWAEDLPADLLGRVVGSGKCNGGASCASVTAVWTEEASCAAE